VRNHRFLAVAVMATLAFAACGKSNNSPSATSTSSSSANKPAITVGSANFTEAIVLGEIYAQGLEAHGYKVTKKLNIGARDVYWKALTSGSVDLLPEYTGALLQFVTKNPSAGQDGAAKTYEDLKTALAKDNVVAFTPAPGEDRDAIVTNKATADKYHLTKVSDLKPIASQLVMGGPPECPTHPASCKGLVDVYGVHVKQFKPLDTSGPVTVQLLSSNQIQLANLFSTDGRIAQQGFVLLQDDKGIAGAENIVPVLRKSVADAGGSDLQNYIDSIDAKLTTAELTDLNKKVDIDKQDASAVAKAWLQSNNLM
jgi:osmoprotectant transport system substrate-binding protein